ncbi:MAG: cysteine desulfurase NifS [Clostridia bacterium]|nr:cysteine desulfurase NifS [Clostridia bacterium]MDH7572447.1 cysteine desulfurase NifS [Clostridia bacterium]
MRRVYLDHSATTPVRPEVVEAMLPYLREAYGNPSSLHQWGQEAKKAVEQAREEVARLVSARPEEIVFTSGGTEANNLAIIGAAYANSAKGRHIITSGIEHHSVLDTMRYLEKQGFKVNYLPVTGEGLVRVEEVAAAISPETILISIMHANNEVGTVQPIAAIGRLARERGIIFHTDAVQTAGKIPVNVEELGVDLLSLSAHKIYGPKGVGALYVRKGRRLNSLLHGGGQERNRRPGTENVPGIVGFGRAAALAKQELAAEGKRLSALRDRLLEGVAERIPEVVITGHRERRLPNHASVCVKYVEGESLLLSLDLQGVAASSGSACTSGSLEPSHVLLAMGLPPEIAQGSLRLTLGRDNQETDVEYVLKILPPIVERLRAMSPLRY